MGAGLLSSLRKYRPREGHDPLENFITEAFAWILREHSDFSSFFLRAIGERSPEHWIDINEEKGEWNTQFNFDAVFPDMVYLSEGKAIIFEHKAWSSLHENQLDNYRNYAGRHFIENCIVLITASVRQHDQNPDVAVCWSDIFTLIESWLRENSDSSFIFKDFLDLLKGEGMGAPAPITHEAIKYYYASSNLKRTISELIDRISRRDWSVYIQQDYEITVPNLRSQYLGQAFGKIGIQLLNGLFPGIYVGVDVDGEPYGFPPSYAEKGPDFCLILEFDCSFHGQYPLNQNYVQLVDRLSTKVATLGEGWELYCCLVDPAVDQYAKGKDYQWRPIYIRKPLLEVFAGTSTGEEQGDRFYDEANKLIKLVTEEDYFWRLREEFRPAEPLGQGVNLGDH
ncbi:MAG: hypothetical protein ACFCBU_11230 [Cyanophyceae cyanobacterium]